LRPDRIVRVIKEMPGSVASGTHCIILCAITSVVQRGTVSGRRYINEVEDDMGRGILDNHEKYVKIAGLAAR